MSGQGLDYTPLALVSLNMEGTQDNVEQITKEEEKEGRGV
jgi:hypothetical protein